MSMPAVGEPAPAPLEPTGAVPKLSAGAEGAGVDGLGSGALGRATTGWGLGWTFMGAEAYRTSRRGAHRRRLETSSAHRSGSSFSSATCARSFGNGIWA